LRKTNPNMNKYISKIFPSGKIIIEHLHGFITWSDILAMKKEEASKPNYNPNYNLITDVRDVEIDTDDLEGMNKYLNYFKIDTKAVGNRKTAILTNSSRQVIHSEILKFKTDSLPMDLKTVSTYDAAFEWTELDSEFRLEIHNFLEVLRKSFFQELRNGQQ